MKQVIISPTNQPPPPPNLSWPCISLLILPYSFCSKRLQKYLWFLFFPFMLKLAPDFCSYHNIDIVLHSVTTDPPSCQIRWLILSPQLTWWLDTVDLSLILEEPHFLCFGDKPLSLFFYYLTGFSFRTLQWLLSHSQ